MAAPGLEDQRALLDQRLNKLRLLIRGLPPLPAGPEDGPIARYFGDFSVDPDEGPYYSVDRAWTRTFQVSDDKKAELICGGALGLPLILRFFEHFASLPDMERYNGLHLLSERIESLSQLILPKVYSSLNMLSAEQLVTPGSSSGGITSMASKSTGRSVLGKRKDDGFDDEAPPKGSLHRMK
ncbi:hypothetical protein B0H21DRAFT_824659 [Amylocystis lapponica]|nr:hypothetical protein B0H21DRAFT_824659 [Amylocystis lapponica]